MKIAVVFLVCVVFILSAMDRTSLSSGYNVPAAFKGTYTVVAQYAVGLPSAYGLAIQDDVANSIWISQYAPLVNNEFDMLTGAPTGYTWPIYNGVDADDMGYCVYAGSPNEFFFGDWASNTIQVYDVSTTSVDPYFARDITGPSAWTTICGVDAGHDNLYVASFFADEIAWGAYTGTESTVSWTTAPFLTVSGMSVWGDYLFVCCQIYNLFSNYFIFLINLSVWRLDKSVLDDTRVC